MGVFLVGQLDSEGRRKREGQERKHSRGTKDASAFQMATDGSNGYGTASRQLAVTGLKSSPKTGGGSGFITGTAVEPPR
jgi:hypothetical protein